MNIVGKILLRKLSLVLKIVLGWEAKVVESLTQEKEMITWLVIVNGLGICKMLIVCVWSRDLSPVIEIMIIFSGMFTHTYTHTQARAHAHKQARTHTRAHPHEARVCARPHTKFNI